MHNDWRLHMPSKLHRPKVCIIIWLLNSSSPQHDLLNGGMLQRRNVRSKQTIEHPQVHVYMSSRLDRWILHSSGEHLYDAAVCEWRQVQSTPSEQIQMRVSEALWRPRLLGALRLWERWNLWGCECLHVPCRIYGLQVPSGGKPDIRDTGAAGPERGNAECFTCYSCCVRKCCYPAPCRGCGRRCVGTEETEEDRAETKWWVGPKTEWAEHSALCD